MIVFDPAAIVTSIFVSKNGPYLVWTSAKTGRTYRRAFRPGKGGNLVVNIPSGAEGLFVDQTWGEASNEPTISLVQAPTPTGAASLPSGDQAS